MSYIDLSLYLFLLVLAAVIAVLIVWALKAQRRWNRCAAEERCVSCGQPLEEDAREPASDDILGLRNEMCPACIRSREPRQRIMGVFVLAGLAFYAVICLGTLNWLANEDDTGMSIVFTIWSMLGIAAVAAKVVREVFEVSIPPLVLRMLVSLAAAVELVALVTQLFDLHRGLAPGTWVGLIGTPVLLRLGFSSRERRAVDICDMEHGPQSEERNPVL